MSLNELLPELHELAPADKLRLIRILAEDLEAEVSPFEPCRSYAVATSTFEPGAAEALMMELETNRGA